MLMTNISLRFIKNSLKTLMGVSAFASSPAAVATPRDAIEPKYFFF